MQSSTYSTAKEIASNILIVPGEVHKGASTKSKETLAKNKKKLKAQACCTPVLSLRLCCTFGTAGPKEGRQYMQIGPSNNSRAYHRAPKGQQLLTKS